MTDRSSFTAHSSHTAVVQRLDGSHRSVMDSSFFSLYTLWNEADGSAHKLHRAASFNHHDNVLHEARSITHLKPINRPKWNLWILNRISLTKSMELNSTKEYIPFDLEAESIIILAKIFTKQTQVGRKMCGI